MEVELANRTLIVCSVTFADSAKTVARLVSALRALARGPRSTRRRSRASRERHIPWPGLPAAALGLRAAHGARTERVRFRSAVSRICAEPVIPYPPGIPALLPGEVIEPDMAAYLQELLADGARITGPEDATLTHIRVVR